MNRLQQVITQNCIIILQYIYFEYCQLLMEMQSSIQHKQQVPIQIEDLTFPIRANKKQQSKMVLNTDMIYKSKQQGSNRNEENNSNANTNNNCINPAQPANNSNNFIKYVNKNDKNNQDGFSSESETEEEIVYAMSECLDETNGPSNDESNKDRSKKDEYARDVINSNKRYSLQPDMITGWAPKIPMSKPIPLTFNNYQFDSIIEAGLKNKKFQMSKPTVNLEELASKDNKVPQMSYKPRLCYLGPRYESTYYAWYDKQFEFPYKHLNCPKNITITDRFFVGQHWNAQPQPQTRSNEYLSKLQISEQDQSKDLNILQFDSIFQSANLDSALKVGQYQYDLFLRVDSNTRGHLQWYYFKVKSFVPNKTYKFNICNFQKGKNLYSRGMRPYCYSKKKYENLRIGWHQIECQVKYRKKISKTQKYVFTQNSAAQYYQLQYSFSTAYDNDQVQFAYCIPYSYTMLKQVLKCLQLQCQDRNILSIRKLCNSLGGLIVDELTITSNVEEEQKLFKSKIKVQGKKVVFITGRCHPGQTNGSWMVDGLIEWLSGSTELACFLRQNTIFKIIPMLNPDGVVLGNYRTGLFGKDFNREFHNPDQDVFPQIYHLKQMFSSYKQIYGQSAMIYLDFHGHSVKKNVFAYGPEYPITHKNYYESRMIAKLISLHSKAFRYHSCIFKISESKESTGRAIFLRTHKIPFTFTVQASNGGYYDCEAISSNSNASNNGVNNNYFDFDETKWKEVGAKVVQGVGDYLRLIVQIQKIRQKKLKQRKQLIIKNRQRAKAKKVTPSNANKVGYLTSMGFRKYKTSPKQQDELKQQYSQSIQREMQIQVENDKNQSENIFFQNYGSVLGLNLGGLNEIKSNSKISLLLDEIQHQTANQDKNRPQGKFSEDQISEGKSDSQSSKDDLDNNFRTQLIALIKQRKRKNKTRTKIKAEPTIKKAQKQIQSTKQQMQSLIQPQQQPEDMLQSLADPDLPSQQKLLQKSTKQILIKKYLWKKKSTVFSGISPKKEEVVAAKIVNFNFSINPLQCSLRRQNNVKPQTNNSIYNSTYYTSKSSTNCLNMKNQQRPNQCLSQQKQNCNANIHPSSSFNSNSKKYTAQKSQYSETFKKTFLSVQKQILRRDSHKRYLVSLNKDSQKEKEKSKQSYLVENVRVKKIVQAGFTQDRQTQENNSIAKGLSYRMEVQIEDQFDVKQFRASQMSKGKGKQLSTQINSPMRLRQQMVKKSLGNQKIGISGKNNGNSKNAALHRNKNTNRQKIYSQNKTHNADVNKRIPQRQLIILTEPTQQLYKDNQKYSSMQEQYGDAQGQIAINIRQKLQQNFRYQHAQQYFTSDLHQFQRQEGQEKSNRSNNIKSQIL